MKTKHIFIMICCFLICFSGKAQGPGSISPFYASDNHEGVYLSANDFTNGKISFGNDQVNKKSRYRLHEMFITPSMKIVIGDSVIKLRKDSIFGYCDKNGVCYRFCNGLTYRILNPSEEILLYTISSLAGVPKNIHNVTTFFFSENANSSLYPLSKWNLKTVLRKDVSFHELLDVYFLNDRGLTVYDSFDKIYFLNHVYEISKQTKNNAINN